MPWYTTADARADAEKIGRREVKTKTCDMLMVESATFQVSWECSECKAQHKDSAKVEKSTACPTCRAEIASWVGLYDDE